MTHQQQLDNQTFREKKALRLKALALLAARGLPSPVVMETHGGAGVLWDACYPTLAEGVVFEKDPAKTARLAKQRPTWAVYECDCVAALRGGVGGHLAVELLDVDPYGDSWPVLDAFFTSDRPRAPLLGIVVNDGLRQKLQVGGAWTVGSMQSAVARHGNDLHPIYLEVCEELLNEKAAGAGYRVDRFGGYYCGVQKHMTHFLAVLVRGEG